MRIVKHIGARVVAADSSKPLIIVPYFPGEKIINVRMNGYFATDDDSAIDEPGECNWHGLSIPWSLVFATNMMNAGNTVSQMTTVANWDTLFNQWLRAADEGTGEKFGGDVDADPEDKSGEEGHVNEELLNSGPIGVHEWFTRERLLLPIAAEGNTVIRFGDYFEKATGPIPTHSMGGIAMLGMVRYDVNVETNFNIELDDTNSRINIGALMAGDYTTIKARIEGDTSAVGDYLRTVLFGGDNYIEASTLKAPSGQAFIKASFVIDGPISRQH